MAKFLARMGQRVVGGMVMVLVVATFTFFLVHLIPGNPVVAQEAKFISQGMTFQQARAQVEAMYGFIPHDSLGQQYLQYLGQILRFHLGRSISYGGIPVSHLILQAMPWTVIMVLSGLVISFIIGVLAGVVAATYRSSSMGTSVTVFSSVLHGIPQFVVALALAFLFGTLWHILPISSPYSIETHVGLNAPFLGSVARHAILPVAAYAISGYGGWALTMKSSVISVLGDDFILASELRGMKPRIRIGYIARNAILPLFTILTLSIGFMFGGSVFIEEIFNYPGLGHLLLSSVGALDYPLMEGAFLLITAAVILSNIVADFLYTFIDPRIRT